MQLAERFVPLLNGPGRNLVFLAVVEVNLHCVLSVGLSVGRVLAQHLLRDRQVDPQLVEALLQTAELALAVSQVLLEGVDRPEGVAELALAGCRILHHFRGLLILLYLRHKLAVALLSAS